MKNTLETRILLEMSYFHCITVKIDCNKNSEILVHILIQRLCQPGTHPARKLRFQFPPWGTCTGKLVIQETRFGRNKTGTVDFVTQVLVQGNVRVQSSLIAPVLVELM